MSIVRTPPAPRPRPSQSARAFAAAKSEYLAGAEAEAVCRRHDIRTAYFLRIAAEQGWRRPDPAAPEPEPPPDPAPAVQVEPLVIPKAPQASSGTPQPAGLTAAQMVDKAWAMLSAAVAAGRLIEARGWLRLHKELQPFVREEAGAERRARMDRDAAALCAAEPADEAVARPLHCFSPPECNTPDPTGGPSYHPGNAKGVIREGTAPRPPGPGWRDATIRATGAVTQASDLRPARPCGCPGGPVTAPLRPGSPPGPGPGSGRDDKDAGRVHDVSRADAIAPRLHCFSRPGCNSAGPDP